MKHKRTAKQVGEDRNLLVSVSYDTHQAIKKQAKSQGIYLGVFCRKIFEDYAKSIVVYPTSMTGCSMAAGIAQTGISSNNCTVNA